MRLIVVAQLAVDLIGQHDQVVLDGSLAMPSRSSRDAQAPVGLVGKFSIITRFRGVIAAARSAGLSENPSPWW
jgi:hypothetical protein